MTDTATSHTDTPSLTPKQEAFARHYAASGNGAAAARAAGYAPDSAKQSAHDLLQHPAVRARIEVLEDAHGRTLRGEVAVMLDRLDTAVDMALQAGDYRAMLDIARLQAQVAALTGAEATQRRALLYDRAGGPGPLARSRAFLDPHAAIAQEAQAPEPHAEAVAAPMAAEAAEDAAAEDTAEDAIGADAQAALRERIATGMAGDAELAEIATALAELEAELEADRRATDPQGTDPDFSLPLSLPLAGALPGTEDRRPPATAREALLASAAPVRVPEGRGPETARRAA